MTFRFVLLLFFTLLSSVGASQNCRLDTLRLEGVNYGRKLHFVNPQVPGRGFAIQKILVNNEPVYEELKSSTVTIHLDRTSVATGDSVNIIILHIRDTNPFLVNPENLLPPDDFNITYIRIRDGKLLWRTIGVPGYRPFVIEQYRWKRWVQVGEVPVCDSLSAGSYEFSVKPHYGSNKFRIVKINGQNEEVVSREKQFSSYDQPKVEMKDKKVEDMLVFTRVTMYEIYDRDWKLLMQGRDRYVDVSDLPKGKYKINYGNTSGTFKKK